MHSEKEEEKETHILTTTSRMKYNCYKAKYEKEKEF